MPVSKRRGREHVTTSGKKAHICLGSSWKHLCYYQSQPDGTNSLPTISSSDSLLSFEDISSSLAAYDFLQNGSNACFNQILFEKELFRAHLGAGDLLIPWG